MVGRRVVCAVRFCPVSAGAEVSADDDVCGVEETALSMRGRYNGANDFDFGVREYGVRSAVVTEETSRTTQNALTGRPMRSATIR